MDSSCLWRMCDPGSTEGTQGVVTPADLWPQLRGCHTHCLLWSMDWSRPPISLYSPSNCLYVCCVLCSCWHALKWKCHWIIMWRDREGAWDRGREGDNCEEANETNEERWLRCGLRCRGVCEWQSKKRHSRGQWKKGDILSSKMKVWT